MHAGNKNLSASEIADLLSRTAQAHGRYEIEVLARARDEAWAAWYAQHLLDNGLQDAFRAYSLEEGGRGQLEELLSQADISHRANAPDEKWEDYYGKYILEALTQK